MNNHIQQYLTQIQTNIQTGVAKEHAHRAALQNLLISLQSTINVINEPKRIACGSPDLVILDKQAVPLGYVEAKDIGISLDKTLKTEQLERYLGFSGNLILTDYLEFRWFADHKPEPKIIVKLANVNKAGKLQILSETFQQFIDLIELFVNYQSVTLRCPEDLAERMAKIAIQIRETILKAYEQKKTGTLHEQLVSFRLILMDSLTVGQFADMYAQTACYGLFAAKCNATLTEPFSRLNANYNIPKTNPFLRNLFNQIVGIDMDERLGWAIEHLVKVLNHADIGAILADFGKRTRQEDPVVHFYETFLKHYDPSMREMRGVYYTPEPVVSYIVRSVDLLWKRQFKLKDGLADSSRLESGQHKVQILDPAVGTGTFLYAILNQIFAKFRRNKGMWSSYVSEHLLPRVHGFELLMAPYTVAHMKLGLQLQNMGYEFDSEERLRIFLTNSLENTFEKGGTQALGFIEWLVNEGLAASEVKQDSPVMVIVGNPPYSYESLNKGEWISQLIRDYYQIDGKPLKERNPKGLQDDYVKFIRFAQWRIEQTGYGILAFVTNHGYLDNPTFRGMRQHLLNSFNEIYILDLHGNAKKKEKSPDGSVDKNVFDIQQGVAIGIFVKHKDKKQAAKVFHADIWGERKGKYAWLEENNVKTTNWQELKPQSPFYLFIPQNVELLGEYEQGWKITEIMPINNAGLYTARDKLTIHPSKEKVLDVITDFVDLEVEQAREKYQLGKDSQDWKIEKAQNDIVEHNIEKSNIVPILYRPFDKRYIFYTGKSGGFICRPRREIMQHMLAGKNLGLITVRKTPPTQQCAYFLATTSIISTGLIRSDNQSVDYLFPLYIYPTEKDEFINGNGNGKPKRKPNFSPNFIKDIETCLNLKFIEDGTGNLTKTIGPEDIFHYIYAIFHSPTYRQRYAEFLKIDFPRLPLTSDKKLFHKLCKLGHQLIEIHLMEADIENESGYPIEGNNLVEKITYKNGKVYINKTQYFDNVKENVWQFHIGGYQVCQKWLKDRKGRELDYDDCNHYLYILVALEQTIGLMEEIDATIPKFPLP
ncbi:N-6 DNA methylase [Thiotrichales bacterium HSG1]|nr:N-6 DNA methylase [Thiotrichales bacterium HSG1]